MEPACTKMTLLVFIAVFAMRARSQTQHSIGSYTTSETERCVCQPHVTINPPVCGRSVPVNSGTGCNSTTVQEILRTVSALSDYHDSVSSELPDMKRQLEMLQSAVTSIVGLLEEAVPSETITGAATTETTTEAATNETATTGATTTEAAATGTCSSCARWSSWLNRDNPSGSGDWEHVGTSGHNPCSSTEPIDIQCRVRGTVQNWSDADQEIKTKCTPSEGFVCVNADQPSGQSCFNYEVRFLCP